MFCSHIECSALEYKSVTTNKSGGKVVQVSTKPGSHEWKDRMRFQMSEDQTQNLQTAVWGLSTPMPGQDASRRTLELTVDSPALLSFLQKLDARNVSEASERCMEWFKKSIEPDALSGMYVALLRQPSKPDAPHTVRVKVKCGGAYPTNIFVVKSEENGEIQYTKGTHDDLTRGVKVMAMVETGGLWFMSRQFGMSLTATELLVWPTTKRPTGIDAFTFAGDSVRTRESQMEF